MNITATLLPFNYIDRSWERVCRKKYATNPNNGIKADLCIVVVVRIERIGDAGVDFLIVTLLFALFMSATLLDCKRPRKPALRFGETGSTIDV
jgi:hypothetical protein